MGRDGGKGREGSEGNWRNRRNRKAREGKGGREGRVFKGREGKGRGKNNGREGKSVNTWLACTRNLAPCHTHTHTHTHKCVCVCVCVRTPNTNPIRSAWHLPLRPPHTTSVPQAYLNDAIAQCKTLGISLWNGPAVPHISSRTTQLDRFVQKQGLHSMHQREQQQQHHQQQ